MSYLIICIFFNNWLRSIFDNNLMRNSVYIILKKIERGVIIDMKLWNIYCLTLMFEKLRTSLLKHGKSKVIRNKQDKL